MSKIIQVRVGEYRSADYFDLNDVNCQRNDYVIVEIDRGSEFGRVISDVGSECKVKPEHIRGKVLRSATDGDLRQIENSRMKARDAKEVCIRKIAERRLDMQIVKAEYTFDSSKIIFFFNAEGRIDFRNLVKDLAQVFRVRIELKQIGVRDRAKMVVGYGVCGREFCCSSYMNDFHTLAIRMAKEQGLPLNPTRISGVCGRIKCCMAYEFAVYKEFARSLPRVGDRIDVPEGKGRVVDINILKRVVSIDIGEGQVVKAVIPKKGQAN